jgi:hypothetical protein
VSIAGTNVPGLLEKTRARIVAEIMLRNLGCVGVDLRIRDLGEWVGNLIERDQQVNFGDVVVNFFDGFDRPAPSEMRLDTIDIVEVEVIQQVVISAIVGVVSRKD